MADDDRPHVQPDVDAHGLQRDALPEACDDRLLVRRFLRGDDQAFNLLFRRHAGPVLQLLTRLTGSESEAQDLTAETFIAAYLGRSSLKRESKFRHWLFGIAANRARNSYRLRRETEPLPEEVPAGELTDPLASLTRKDEAQELAAAIAELPDAFRVVFELVCTEGLKYKEAARLLDLPIGTISTRMLKARRLLQEKLNYLREDGTAPSSVSPTCPSPTPSDEAIAYRMIVEGKPLCPAETHRKL